MTERTRVYEAIDSERDYQDERWGYNPSEKEDKRGSLDRTIDEFATYIASYSQQLTQTCSITDDPTLKLDVVRKIAALGVACMEAHGAPNRE